MNYGLVLTWSSEDAAYVCTSPEFPGISAFGATPEIAVGEMKVALAAAQEVYRDEGVAVPEPVVATEYSGQFRLRIPRQLHAALAHRAAIDGVSLNALATSFIASSLGTAGAVEMVKERLEPWIEKLERARSNEGRATDRRTAPPRGAPRDA